VLGEGPVDVLEIGRLAAARGAVIDDLALDLPLLEIDDRHRFERSELRINNTIGAVGGKAEREESAGAPRRPHSEPLYRTPAG
jgi:hypothetical protein